jgi:hypothetical protein
VNVQGKPGVRFDWDRGNIEHIARHAIIPAEAEEVVRNEPIDLRFENRDSEERIAQVGETHAGRVLVVVTTMRGDKVRVGDSDSSKPQVAETVSRREGRFP